MGVAKEPDSVRALQELGRRFLEVLDSIVEAVAPVKIKPLEDLDFKIPELPPFKLNLNEYAFRGEVPPFPFPELPPVFVKPAAGEVRLVMGGRDVGRATLDGEGNMQGEVLDMGAIEQLRGQLLGGLSIAPDYRERNLRAIREELEELPWPEVGK